MAPTPTSTPSLSPSSTLALSTSTTETKCSSTSAAIPTPTNGIRILRPRDCKQAAASLAEAFVDDEVSRYFLDPTASPAKQLRVHNAIIEYVTSAHLRAGLVTAIGEPGMPCVALWAPPHTSTDGLMTTLRSGLWRLRYQLSREGRHRFFEEFFPLLHDTKHAVLGERDPEAWYLVYIGTLASGRGKGYARRSIEWVARQADAEGRAMYLESSNIVNVRFYESCGFVVKKRIGMYRGGSKVELDIMVREPVVGGNGKKEGSLVGGAVKELRAIEGRKVDEEARKIEVQEAKTEALRTDGGSMPAAAEMKSAAVKTEESAAISPLSKAIAA